MEWQQDIVPETWNRQDGSALARLLRPGGWLTESAHPPAAHRPEILMQHFHGTAGTGISLHSDTVLNMDLAALIIDKLAEEGCLLEGLARVALHEIVLNAAIHGNLEVDSGASNDWAALAFRQQAIDAALRVTARAHRNVTIACAWNDTTACLVVADEGRGYDAANLTAPLPQPPPPPGGMRRGAGHGLLIARAAADVHILQGGRCVRLAFARQPAGPHA